MQIAPGGLLHSNMIDRNQLQNMIKAKGIDDQHNATITQLFVEFLATMMTQVDAPAAAAASTATPLQAPASGAAMGQQWADGMSDLDTSDSDSEREADAATRGVLEEDLAEATTQKKRSVTKARKAEKKAAKAARTAAKTAGAANESTKGGGRQVKTK